MADYWYHNLLLFGASAVAGAVNAVAGGGTLLTFPSLMWAGQSARIANATSTVALWPGQVSSLWAYRSEMKSSCGELVLLAIPSFLGGLLGALLLLKTSEQSFALLVPYLVLLATLLFIVQEPITRWQRRRQHATQTPGPAAAAVQLERSPGWRWAGVLVFQFLIGTYGGYFGAGIGILMLAAYGFLGLTNIHHMNALKNLNNLTINGVAAILFVLKGMVDWRLASLMAVGAILGGYAGAGTARRIGQKTVRRVIIAIGLGLTVWLLLKPM